MADLVAPAHLWVPDYDERRTLGPEVAAVATLAGFPPDPEQQLLLDAAFALDANGKSVAFEVVVVAPRQNLKTGFFKQYALGQLFVRGEALVVWSAHEFATSQEALRDMEALIGASDWLSSQVKLTSRGEVAKHGAVPVIELKPRPGQEQSPRLIFKTRTTGGGRGLSGRKVILDEGFALQPGQVGALTPVMLAQPDPQMAIGSSACRPESSVLWDAVQRGRAQNSPRLVYAEWCAPPPETVCDLGAACDHSRGIRGCGCDKPEVIVLAHSAIRRNRILLETVTDLRSTMPPEEYGREVMGWHDRVAEGEAAVPYGLWSAARKSGSGIVGGVVLAVEVAEDHSWAALTAAGPGSVLDSHVEVVDYRPGTAWVAARAAAVAKRHGCSMLLARKSAAAGALIPDLKAAGLYVVPVTSEQYAQACGMAFDALADGRAAHIGQPELDAAVAGARRRASGDAFVWDQRRSGVEISPFGGCTLALWGHLTGAGKVAGRGRVVALS